MKRLNEVVVILDNATNFNALTLKDSCNKFDIFFLNPLRKLY